MLHTAAEIIGHNWQVAKRFWGILLLFFLGGGRFGTSVNTQQWAQSVTAAVHGVSSANFTGLE